jgi:hypothetical protein
MKKPVIYFYCSKEKYNYQHDIVLLAEGLKELGIPFYGSTDYWQQSPGPDSFLFSYHSHVRPEDCDVVVFPGTWFYWVTLDREPDRKALPLDLDQPNRKYKAVYLDSSDGYQTVSWEDSFRKFDLILRSHFNKRSFHPANVVPWTFGIPNRVLKEFAAAPTFASRSRKALSNFGASHGYNHGLRSLAEQQFYPAISPYLPIDFTKDAVFATPEDPYEKLMWEQCWGRFNRNYFKRLAQAQACMCFCGELVPSLPYNPANLLVGGKKAALKRKALGYLDTLLSQPPRSIQWDSWRFWESLAAQTVPIHIDLEKYGVCLPVMPRNWKHYIGIDLNRISDTVARIKEEEGVLEKISAEGHQWAMEHYSPKPMVQRFLQLLGYAWE